MLSTTSKYAIRALVEMAKRGEGETIFGHQLSEVGGVPANYLAKIMTSLRRAGFIKTERGRKGGYRLSRSPETVTLLEVVKVFEGEEALPDCILQGNRVCSDDSPCEAHGLWKEVKERYQRFLENTTITQIARKSKDVL